MHRTEEHELMRKYGRDVLGCIDLGHSDSPHRASQWSPLDTHLKKIFKREPFAALAQHNETVPSDLRALAADALFVPLGGYDGDAAITGANIAVWPETSTFLLKCAVLWARDRAGGGKVSVLMPEGNFRYNFSIEHVTGADFVTVPVDDQTKKITPKSLRDCIHGSRSVPVALVLETPNNPWMQAYTKPELRALMRVALDHNVLVINDQYLAGTESPGSESSYCADAIDAAYGTRAEQNAARENLVTVRGTRRAYGADKRAKAGFAASHNTLIIDSIIRRVRAVHMRWNAGRYHEVRWLLGRAAKPSSLRKDLAILRTKAERAIRSVTHLRIIIPAKAGPFITVGFSPELEARLRALGFADRDGVIDGYRVVEYIMLKSRDGKKPGVLLMPLSAMYTETPGFRLNATVSGRDFTRGLDALERGLSAIRRDEQYDTVRDELDEIRANIALAQAEKLRRDA